MYGTEIRFFDFGIMSLLFPSDSSDANCRYAYITDSDGYLFRTDANDFAIEWVGHWDSSCNGQGNWKCIIQKAPPFAGSDYTYLNGGLYGWAISLIPNSKTIRIAINDGSPTALYADFSNVWYPDGVHFFRMEILRNTTVKLYVDGNLAGSSNALTGRTGPLNNTYPIQIGGNQGSPTSFLKGSIGMIRLDTGAYNPYDEGGGIWWYTYGAIQHGDAWNKEAYWKYYYRWPMEQGHYRNCWYFQHTLSDNPGGYQGPKTFIFKDGYGSVQTPTYGSNGWYASWYAFRFNPLPGGHEWGPIDLNSRMRSLDGTLRVYKGPNKRHKTWKFRTSDPEQIYAIMGAWYTSVILSIYDISDPNRGYQPPFMRGVLASAPTINEIARRGDPFGTLDQYFRIWEVTMEFAEI